MATMLAALGESIVLTEALDLSVSDLLEVLYVDNFSLFASTVQNENYSFH